MKTPSTKTCIEFTLPLTREEAERIVAQGQEAAVFVMLELSARLSRQDMHEPSPSTPSAMVPVYAKPAAPKRSKKPGAKHGHPGSRRRKPEVTRREEHPPMKQCPACGARDSSGGDHPKELAGQPQREGRAGSGGADVGLSHAQTARP